MGQSSSLPPQCCQGQWRLPSQRRSDRLCVEIVRISQDSASGGPLGSVRRLVSAFSVPHQRSWRALLRHLNRSGTAGLPVGCPSDARRWRSIGHNQVLPEPLPAVEAVFSRSTSSICQDPLSRSSVRLIQIVHRGCHQLSAEYESFLVTSFIVCDSRYRKPRGTIFQPHEADRWCPWAGRCCNRPFSAKGHVSYPPLNLIPCSLWVQETERASIGSTTKFEVCSIGI